MQLDDRVAIVTGGAKGIGREFCRALAREGARVVVADVDMAGAETTARDIGGTAIEVDVSREDSTRSMAERALALNGRIDILVNNAGIYAQLLPLKPFDEISVEEWDRVMGINLRGPWLCAKAVAPTFRRQRSGVIVNVSSTTPFYGVAGFLHYVASKAGIIGMTRSMARELGDDGVRVNAITPGLTSTESALSVYTAEDINKRVAARSLKREETAEDLGGAIVFLCSDASGFITGQTLNVDGGQIMH